jgi:hypothetical protein
MRDRNAVPALPAPRVERSSLPRLGSILMVVPFRQHEMQHEGLCAERHVAVRLGGRGRREQVFHDAMIGASRYCGVSSLRRVDYD